MDCIVHGVAKSPTRLSDFHFHFSLCRGCSSWLFYSLPFSVLAVGYTGVLLDLLSSPINGWLKWKSHLIITQLENNTKQRDFPGGTSGKEPVSQCRIHKKCRFNPWVGKILPGGGDGNPLQYSFLENPMDSGAWRTRVHGVTESQTQLKRLSSSSSNSQSRNNL